MILLITTAIVSCIAGCGIALITIGVCATGKRADVCEYCNGYGVMRGPLRNTIDCPMCHGATRRKPTH